MLKFTKDSQRSNSWLTLWKAKGNCETDYQIERIENKYYVTVSMYNQFVEETGSFAYFKDAKAWAKLQDSYLEM